MTELNCFVPDSVGHKSTGSGVLNGKTFAAKDLFAVKGHTSSFGNAGWRNTHNPSSETAPVITALLKAGAIMTGQTKMDQLAYSVVGNVGEGVAPLNSLYPDRFTCGSSSGSASAVAGGVVDFALGTDTAGSIRAPAAACGLYSIRPTHGKIDSTGVLPMAPSFDSVSLIAREPKILKQAFEVLSPNAGKQVPFSHVLLPTDCLELVSDKAAKTVRQTAEKLAHSLNTTVEEIELGKLDDTDTADLTSRLQSRELWSVFGDWVLQNKASLAKDVISRLAAAEGFSDASKQEKVEDLKALQDYRQEISKVIKPGSVAVMPIMYDLPPKRNETADNLLAFRKLAYRLAAPASLSGLPEVVIPIKTGDLTYGVGLLGAKDSDLSLIELATTKA